MVGDKGRGGILRLGVLWWGLGLGEGWGRNWGVDFMYGMFIASLLIFGCFNFFSWVLWGEREHFNWK